MSLHTVDVIIIGAGPAGLAAAVSVARAGGSAFLIERSARLGGSATNARVGTVCGLSRCGHHLTEAPSFDNPGFASEFSMRVGNASGTSLIRNENGLSFLPYNPAAFESVANDYLQEVAQDVRVVTSACHVRVSKDPGNSGFSVDLPNHVVSAKALVDCSGNLWAGETLGAKFITPDPYQAGALVFELVNLPDLGERELAFFLRKTVREGALEGSIPERCSYVSIVPGSLRRSERGIEAAFKLGTEAPTSDALMASIEEQARCDIEDLVSFMRSREQLLSSLQCSSIAPSLGVRSGRRGVGVATLTDEAVRKSVRCADGIAVGLWPIEQWKTPVKPEVTFPEEGDFYEIPVGTLCSVDVPGLYFAGRSISASELGIASARVIGTSLSTGFAAGRVALGYAHGESTASVIRELRSLQVDGISRSRP